MSAGIPSVRHHAISRMGGTVHLFVETDQGSGTFGFTLGRAESIARELARAAAFEERPADADPAPILKPSGCLL